jgi:hypothetical protein
MAPDVLKGLTDNLPPVALVSMQAVINSRDMSLVLAWKFFDQNVAMTRMRDGRVVLFDFSTEYDVKVTPQFLDYLKYVSQLLDS